LRTFYILAFLLFLVGGVQAQFGNRYLWSDSLAAATTAVDTTFTESWEYASIYSDTVDIEIKVGAPDTTGWSSRKWIQLTKGATLSIGPTPKLKRIEFRTIAGSGTLFIVGTKSTRQY